MAIIKNMIDDISLVTASLDDDLPINFRTIKKTVSVNGVWEERIFYEIKPFSHDALNWLNKHYGKHNYQITWWPTHTSIVMRDSIYTHWKLCQ